MSNEDKSGSIYPVEILKLILDKAIEGGHEYIAFKSNKIYYAEIKGTDIISLAEVGVFNEQTDLKEYIQ